MANKLWRCDRTYRDNKQIKYFIRRPDPRFESGPFEYQIRDPQATSARPWDGARWFPSFQEAWDHFKANGNKP